MSAAQGAHASALYYVPTAAGHGPMYAYPVQYPDGRIMYHILPPQVTLPLQDSRSAVPLRDQISSAQPQVEGLALSVPELAQARSGLGNVTFALQCSVIWLV